MMSVGGRGRARSGASAGLSEDVLSKDARWLAGSGLVVTMEDIGIEVHPVRPGDGAGNVVHEDAGELDGVP